MTLKVDELIMEIMSMHKNVSIQSLYDAIRVLLTADDNRVVASEVSLGFILKAYILTSCRNGPIL